MGRSLLKGLLGSAIRVLQTNRTYRVYVCLCVQVHLYGDRFFFKELAHVIAALQDGPAGW